VWCCVLRGDRRAPGGLVKDGIVTVFVALLRGVNVGGKAKLPMAELRRLAESCGLEDVQTYIQSGNLVFRTRRRSASAISTALREAIRTDIGIDPAVILRTAAELRSAVEANPFLARGAEAAQLHAVFLDEAGPSSALDGLDRDKYLPEEFEVRGREVYLLLPNGMGRSQLAADLGRRGPVRDGTARNWRTVTTLLDMADKLA
jgi:uncharacterized protein (DUF1697 family)